MRVLVSLCGLAMVLPGLGGAAPGYGKGVDPEWVRCIPAQVAVVPGSRIHVRCLRAVGGLSVSAPGDLSVTIPVDFPSSSYEYLAIRTDRPDDAHLILELALEAKRTGKSLIVLHDPGDLSGQSWGCLNADCRPIQAAILE